MKNSSFIKNNYFKVVSGIALLIFFLFYIIMGQDLTETLTYYLIVDEDDNIMDTTTYQYSDSVRFWVADSGYVILSATFNPGIGTFVNTYDYLEIVQTYGLIITESRIDTQYSWKDALSEGTIRMWVDVMDSSQSSWTLASDTAVLSDPGSLFVADSVWGYISTNKLGFIPYDIRITAKCDSDSVGIVKMRNDSYIESTWRMREGKF